MTDYVWNGTTQDWHEPTNWTPNGVPTSVDNVSFIGSGYILCWPVLDIECNNLTLSENMTEMLLVGANAIIYGDFWQREGYFGPTGGPDHIIEFKGNILREGGTFAVGTGPGIDPLCDLSGIGKTYINNAPSNTGFQNLLISGTYVFSGTKLSLAGVSQEFSVTGEFRIDKTGLTVNRIDLYGTWGIMTGIIHGQGRIFYHYDENSLIPTTGTIECKYFTINVEDALVTVNPRTFNAPNEFEIEYTIDATIVRFLGTARHYFNKLTIHCTESSVDTAMLDFHTNTAQIWCNDKFDIYQNAFPSAIFTIDLGDGIHVFRGSIDFYFSYTSSTTHLIVIPREGFIFLYARGRELAVPIGRAGRQQIVPILRFVQYRLSRVYSGGNQDYITYNKVYLFGQYPVQASAKFIEGFGAFEFVIESWRATYQFRKMAVPIMIHEFDRLKIIGSEMDLPTIRAWLSITPTPTQWQINDECDSFSVKLRDVDASYGIPLLTDNSELYGDNINVESYDRDIRCIDNQRNVLEEREVINSTPVPESVCEPILEAIMTE